MIFLRRLNEAHFTSGPLVLGTCPYPNVAVKALPITVASHFGEYISRLRWIYQSFEVHAIYRRNPTLSRLVDCPLRLLRRRIALNTIPSYHCRRDSSITFCWSQCPTGFQASTINKMAHTILIYSVIIQ